MLIPRMRNWVNTYYPGTPIAITEYNWGAEDDMNGATTLADILGIFGREGLDMATYWTIPASTSPTFKVCRPLGVSSACLQSAQTVQLWRLPLPRHSCAWHTLADVDALSRFLPLCPVGVQDVPQLRRGPLYLW